MSLLQEHIKDASVSDNEIWDELLEVLKDKEDESGNIIPPTDKEMIELEKMRELMFKLRPAVMERLRLLAIEQHQGCCCANVYQEREHNTE